MRLLRSSAPLAALSTAACLTPHVDEERPDLQALMRGEVREEWVMETADGAYDRTPFWMTFEDPVLDALVVEALEHNHDLVASAERLRAAAARSLVSRSARRPQIDARFDAARQKQVFVGFPGGVFGNTFNQYAVGADVSWELDLWGKLKAGVDAADADVQAFYADYQGARLSIAAQVTTAWFVLRETTEQVRLAEETLATYDRSLGVVQDRYDAGLSGALDLRLSEANVAGSRAQLAVTEQARAAAARQIEILLGRYPAAELEIAGNFEGLPPAVPAGVPAAILGRRPDLVAIERGVAAAEALARQARLDRLPSIALTASGGSISTELEDLLDGDFSVWSLAGRLVVPLIDGGRRRAQIAESLAALREARSAYASAALRAFFEVENSLDAERRLMERLGHLEEAAVRSREATELADDQYREGLVSIEIVLDSQRRQLQAESAFLVARRELYQNRVDLHVALGGNFDADPELADDAVDALETDDPATGDEIDDADPVDEIEDEQ
ncbi:MAG: efflux transporter outer membrane subunit [Planctomycetota bacterium]